MWVQMYVKEVFKTIIYCIPGHFIYSSEMKLKFTQNLYTNVYSRFIHIMWTNTQQKKKKRNKLPVNETIWMNLYRELC